MTPSTASRTALGASLMRALHSRHDPAPLINDDWGDRLVPDAVRAAVCERVLADMPPAARAEAASNPAAVLARALRANAAYADVITRTRYAEDALEAGVVNGVSQYVIIGAGFDSFAYRRPGWASALSVYEVDHPATQALKRERLAQCVAGATASVEYIAAELSKEMLGAALARSSFRSDRLTFVSWLGVTMYLSRKDNLSALESIATSAPPGSELVFNYVDQAILEPGAVAPEDFRKLRAKVASAGEAFLSGFDPASLAAELRAVGLSLLEDVNGVQAVARYDPAGVNKLRPGSAGHLAHARVTAPRS